MAWLKKDCRLRGHPKLIACADALDLKPVYLEGHLDSFWLACLERYEDGDISGISNTEIAILAEYNTKNADRFVQLLQKHRWLDDHLIHDWLDYVGDYLKGKYRKSPEKLIAIYKKHGREGDLKKPVHVGTCPVRVPDVYVTRQDRDIDKETTHTSARAREPSFSTSSIDELEPVFLPSYELCLSTWKDVSGKGVDQATRDGAKTLAQAIDGGDLRGEDLAGIIRNGLRDVSDGKLPNQTLRGIARNWTRYVPEKKREIVAVPKPDPVLYTVWVQKCPKCGTMHRTERRAFDGEPPYSGGEVCGFWAKTENPDVRAACEGILPRHEKDGEVWK